MIIFNDKPLKILSCLLLMLIYSNVHAAAEGDNKQVNQLETKTIEVAPVVVAPVVIKQDWYSIEYIVFEHNTAESQLTEPWTGAPISPPENPIFLNTADAERSSIYSLDASQQQLYGVYSRLKALNSYTPIRHDGWIQRAEENSPVVTISITPSIKNDLLQGSISLRREHYTHLDIDLQLNEINDVLAYQGTPNTSNQYSSGTSKTYRLTETRRVKNGTINYFDHPRFGVIAKIEEIDQPH